MADIAHANENDTDLHGDTDASHWAERFASKFAIVRQNAAPGEDEMPDTEGTLLAWFAGAIETGRMVGAAAERERIIQLASAMRASIPADHPEGAQASFADYLRVASDGAMDQPGGPR